MALGQAGGGRRAATPAPQRLPRARGFSVPATCAGSRPPRAPRVPPAALCAHGTAPAALCFLLQGGRRPERAPPLRLPVQALVPGHDPGLLRASQPTNPDGCPKGPSLPGDASSTLPGTLPVCGACVVAKKDSWATELSPAAEQAVMRGSACTCTTEALLHRYDDCPPAGPPCPPPPKEKRRLASIPPPLDSPRCARPSLPPPFFWFLSSWGVALCCVCTRAPRLCW